MESKSFHELDTVYTDSLSNNEDRRQGCNDEEKEEKRSSIITLSSGNDKALHSKVFMLLALYINSYPKGFKIKKINKS